MRPAHIRVCNDPAAGSVLQSDETSVRVGKRNWWLWTFHHGQDCCFVIRASRGKDVVADFLGDVRPAVWVSDRYGAQMGWANPHFSQLPHRRRAKVQF